MSTSRGGILAALVAVILIALLALADLVLVAGAYGLVSDPGVPAEVAGGLTALWTRQPDLVTFALALHGMAAVPIALLLLRRPGRPVAVEQPTEPRPAPGPDPHAVALQLLAALQREGRLVDFLEEDIDPYSDEQVGAAVRAIHAGCRKALHERMQIERIYPEPDGAEVEVAEGFDPAIVRLTGNVSGRPPFRGVLRHGGWRATEVRLPSPPAGVDPTVLAPAEVEVP